MNQLDPTVIVRGDVTMGTGNVIHPYCILQGPLELGDGNVIGPFVVLGSPGEDTRDRHYDASRARVVIGSRNIIREHSAVQKPRYADVTRIGSDVFVMSHGCVPHDVAVEDGVVLAPKAAVCGLVHLMECAYVAAGASVHQRAVIGAYAIVAQGAAATRNLKPFARYIPGKALSVNRYAVEKYGYGALADQIEAYVERGETPQDARLRALVSRYEALAAASGMRAY